MARSREASLMIARISSQLRKVRSSRSCALTPNSDQAQNPMAMPSLASRLMTSAPFEKPRWLDTEQSGQFGHGPDEVGVRMRLQLRARMRPRSHADDQPAPGVGPFQQIGRRV